MSEKQIFVADFDTGNTSGAIKLNGKMYFLTPVHFQRTDCSALGGIKWVLFLRASAEPPIYCIIYKAVIWWHGGWLVIDNVVLGLAYWIFYFKSWKKDTFPYYIIYLSGESFLEVRELLWYFEMETHPFRCVSAMWSLSLLQMVIYQGLRLPKKNICD